MVPNSLTVRRIQRTTIACVALLAVIAAVVSFRHMHELCLRHGEDHLAAVLIPLAVDGIIVVASMSILLANRYGSRGGALAWTLLVVGSLASLGANVAVAEPGLIGRVIAAWPSIALIGSYELLMSQIRRVSWNTERQPPEPQQDGGRSRKMSVPEKAWWSCIGRRGGGRGRTADRTGRSLRDGRSPNASSAAPAGAAGSNEQA
ncbi:DUF2637 domain-containing protein [Streptosporangium sp. NPDC001559]|uniref:DUF2637 domain-containing protein n=1 Tax=Streptosporangium sp. NPDC001559 TaxID=3366187 RepID=UPI0036F143FB